MDRDESEGQYVASGGEYAGVDDEEDTAGNVTDDEICFCGIEGEVGDGGSSRGVVVVSGAR